jgi:hypothetical protein
MPKLKCERGEVYVWNPRQFYQKIVCPMCDERGGGYKELTVPHFRKHLEQVHTMEEIESVHVCQICHRQAVLAKIDRFEGLVSITDDNNHQKHNNLKHDGTLLDLEMMISIYEKQKKSANDAWGLEGVEKDPEKVYKYATKKRGEEQPRTETMTLKEERVRYDSTGL